MNTRAHLLIGATALTTLVLLTLPAPLQGIDPEAGAVLPASGDNGLAAQRGVTMQNLAAMPLAFTENRGQWDERVRFRATAGGATLWFCRDGITYQFTHRVPRQTSGAPPARVGSATVGQEPAGAGAPDMVPHGLPWDAWDGRDGIPQPAAAGGHPTDHEQDSIETVVVHAAFVGSNSDVELAGESLLEYRCNYFLGNEPAQWRTDVPNYAVVVYRDVYPGVDLRYEGENGVLKCSQTAATESDLVGVKFRYEGFDSAHPKGNAAVSEISPGQFRVEAPWGTVGESLPASETPAPASAVMTSGASSVNLVYSTYLGGGGYESGEDIAVDANGNAYVVGYTFSTDFPTLGSYQTDKGGMDVFVTKLDSAGNALVYSTYLGGGSNDYGRSIAVDGIGQAYVTGETYSTDFPTFSPYQAHQGGVDVFVTKLSVAANSLVYSTYLGGSGDDRGFGIAVDASENAYVAGQTYSTDFPTLSPYQTHQSGLDVFVTKLNSAGSALVYSTYLGGGGGENGRDIAVDGSGSAYVTGYTYSTDFPMVGPYQTHRGGYDAFVTRLNGAGSALVYSTYLGGGLDDFGYGIAVDGTGSAYVTGATYSSDFPTSNPYQAQPGGRSDVFVTKMNAAGNALVYSTYLGGQDHDNGYGIAVDGGALAYVSGSTISSDFPDICHYKEQSGVAYDVFVAKLSKDGDSPIYGTCLGGSYNDYARHIAVSGAGAAYVTGMTSSTNFPTVHPYQTDQGGDDAFVTKLTLNTPPVAVCQDVTVGAEASCQAIVAPSAVNNGSSDAEDGTNLTLVLVPAGPYTLGVNRVQLIVTDTQGAADTCDAFITVIDRTPPVAACPSDTVVAAPRGQSGVTVEFNCAVSDNCPGGFVTCVPPSGSFFLGGTTTVTCVASDGAGSRDTCSFSVTVCACPCHGDPLCDGTANVQDVVQTIDVFFRGAAAMFDPHCPRARTDVDCDGVTTAADVVAVIDVAFSGVNPATEYCHPCAP